MPNYTSDRYRFDGGYWIWFLDREKDKIKNEIIEHKKDISSLCLDERKELDRLKRGDKRVSRKLRNIWEEKEEALEMLLKCQSQLEQIESEVDQYRPNQ